MDSEEDGVDSHRAQVYDDDETQYTEGDSMMSAQEANVTSPGNSEEDYTIHMSATSRAKWKRDHFFDSCLDGSQPGSSREHMEDSQEYSTNIPGSSHEHFEDTEGDSSPIPCQGCTQRSQRRQRKKTKQADLNEVLITVQKHLHEISQNKKAGKCPTPPKKDRKRKGGSKAWDFFVEVTVDGKDGDKCTLCGV